MPPLVCARPTIMSSLRSGSSSRAAATGAIALSSLTMGAYTLRKLYRHLRQNRWSILRTSDHQLLRRLYQRCFIYSLALRINYHCSRLPPPIDATDAHPGVDAMLEDILEEGPDTFQRKVTNRVQIESLVGCVHALVDDMKSNTSITTTTKKTTRESAEEDGETTSSSPALVIMDVGAGKALFTRALYESFGRMVATVAFDCRRASKRDEFYDPPPPAVNDLQRETTQCNGDDKDEKSFTRIVADVRYLTTTKNLEPLASARNGGLIAVTKHLCGGATDSTIEALCRQPLSDYVGGTCLAPCCHQKTRRDQYCNLKYLQSLGFCSSHVGKRGGTQDNDFRTFAMLISMSKMSEDDVYVKKMYAKSTLLKVLGFKRASELGRKVRRLIEEGRMRYLRDVGGFTDVRLVRYCSREVTGDNLAIICKR